MIQKFDWIEKNLRPLFFQSRSNIWYLVFLCPISCTKSGTSARVGTMWPSDCSYIWLIWNEAQDFVTTVGCDLEASLKGDCIQKVDRVHGQWTLWQHDLLPSCPELESGQNELLSGQCGPWLQYVLKWAKLACKCQLLGMQFHHTISMLTFCMMFTAFWHVLIQIQLKYW